LIKCVCQDYHLQLLEKVKYDGNCLGFPDGTDVESLEQAGQQAEWLSKWKIHCSIKIVENITLTGKLGAQRKVSCEQLNHGQILTNRFCPIV
jgi:hypothetical protein